MHEQDLPVLARDVEAMLAAHRSGVPADELTGRAWSLPAGLPDPLSVLLGAE